MRRGYSKSFDEQFEGAVGYFKCLIALIIEVYSRG